MPVAVRVILAEHQVPDLHITVAVAADLAVRLAAAMFGAAVIVNFRAGTAGAGTVFPEVVLLAEADHVIGRDADFLGPDIIGFIIVKVDGDKQLFGRDLKVFGQEFPRPGDDLLLEIILEAEVAQHFKEGAVAGRDAHALDIRRADALLAGGHTVAGRFFLAKEPLFHRRHAAVDQQQAGVVLGHKREAAQAQVVFGFKKVQVFFAQFIQSGPLHVSCSSHFRSMCTKRASGRQNKTAPAPSRDESCDFRGTTQVAGHGPAAFVR